MATRPGAPDRAESDSPEERHKSHEAVAGRVGIDRVALQYENEGGDQNDDRKEQKKQEHGQQDIGDPFNEIGHFEINFRAWGHPDGVRGAAHGKKLDCQENRKARAKDGNGLGQIAE